MLKRYKWKISLLLLLLILFFVGIKAGSYIRTKSYENNNVILSAKLTNKPIKAMNNKFMRHNDLDMYRDDKKENHRNKVEGIKRKLEEEHKKLIIKNTIPIAAKPMPPQPKIAYLTFDDGPSSTTPQVLDILKKYNIKATFFVIGKEAEKNKQLVNRIAAEGHILANHTYCHDELIIYSSPENFINDINKCEKVLKSIVPKYKSKLIRFPYGSRKFATKGIIDAVINLGYHYADWNCLSRDAEIPNATPEVLLNEIKLSSQNKFKLTVLMHDSVPNTAASLPKIIDYLKSQGYSFKLLK